MKITNIKSLAKSIGCNETIESISRTVYKNTPCGAWVEKTTKGILIGSIVEGVDFGTETKTLIFPFTAKKFWDTVDEVNDEAGYIWQQTHGCDDCDMEGEWGHNAINPKCKSCKGEGIIL